MSTPVTDLCIGGGGHKGLSFVGALEYIINTQPLNLTNFYGCSIGSMIGIFYIIGYTPRELLEFIINIDLKEYWDLDINKIQGSYSVLSNKIFIYFKSVFKERENEYITFKEFYEKYNININILTVSMVSKETVTFSHSTHPDVYVFDALTASCSIPLMFPPTEINGEFYVDGCTKNLYGCPKEHINGYTIILAQQKNRKITDMRSFSCELMVTLAGYYNPDSKYIIEVDLGEDEQMKMDFGDIGYNYKVELYYKGLKSAKKILSEASACKN